MSSLFRNSTAGCVSGAAYLRVVVIAVFWCASADAAQYYFQPTVEVSAEQHSNLGLDPAVDSSSEQGYNASLSGLLGIATPRSDTQIKTWLHYPNYPDREDTGKLEGKVDLFSYYRSSRSTMSITSRFERRDETRGELPDAQVDVLDPNRPDPTPPTTPETGRVLVGATRDLIFLGPGYSYEISPRLAFDASAMYQKINYEPDGVNNAFIDFDFYRAQVALRRAVTQRTNVSIGPYFGRYESGDGSSKTDATGAAMSVEWRWSQTAYTGVNAFVEREKSDGLSAAGGDDTATAYGAEATLTFKQLVSNVYLNLGRTVTPSGAGGVFYSDQLQVQYGRDLSQRSSMILAARYLKDHSVTSALSTNDRDYAQADVEFKWQLTRTWYVRTGYELTWQEYKVATGDAHDHKFHVAFGYQGLSPRR